MTGAPAADAHPGTRRSGVQAGRQLAGLIITADDFGLDPAVNAAVEQASVHGVLDAASLMVSAPAAADAVARAKRLPALAVGLHLVLADGPATLPRNRIPDLVDTDGRFGDHMARDGARFFFIPRIRRQLAAEIRAQFEAFARTGLALDHVNAHKHFHLHPTVLSLVMSIGREFGAHAIRLPAEPGTPWWLRPWVGLLRWRLDRGGFAHNDHIFGIADSGAMDERALLRALAHLPAGLTEIYGHPATHGGLTPGMRDYRHADELAALLSPRVQAAINELGVRRGGFAALA